jgi:hypothetical protein
MNPPRATADDSIAFLVATPNGGQFTVCGGPNGDMRVFEGFSTPSQAGAGGIFPQEEWS